MDPELKAKLRNYEDKVLEIVRNMHAEGIPEGNVAELLQKTAELCRPNYVICRGRAPVFGDADPELTRAAVAEWARSIAPLGGAATKGLSTERKARSSRENGKKGGRPRKFQP
jgi:hypothetical protein